MELVTVHALKELFPDIDDEHAKQLCEFLIKIDCPDNFRSLRVVLNLLFDLKKDFQSYSIHCLDFDFSSELEQQILKVNDIIFTIYSDTKIGKGWKSQRPIYAALLEMYIRKSIASKKSLLTFLKHFFNNQNLIINQDREEECVRAFRKLFFSDKFDYDCFSSEDPKKIALRLEDIRSQLNTDKYGAEINYMRQLEHFYRLDWRYESRFKRSSNTQLKTFYHPNKKNKVSGDDFLYAFTLKAIPISAFQEASGISNNENFPAVSIVYDSASFQSKAKYKLPSIAEIRDREKEKLKHQIISQNVKRAHNLNALSKNVFQIHEFYALWKELHLSSSTSIKGINKQNIRQMILLALFLNQPILSVCQLKFINLENGDNGFFKQNRQWFYKVKYASTALRSEHRLNPQLLKTKDQLFISIPHFVEDILCLDHTKKLGTRLFNLKGSQAILAVEQFIESINRKHHIQISRTKIEHFLNNRSNALETIDPVVVSALSGEINYNARAARHYAWYSDEEINERIADIWRDIFAELQQFDPCFQPPEFQSILSFNDTKGIGSQFTPTKQSIEQKIDAFLSLLNAKLQFDVSKSLDGIIQYHNLYTCYTCFMLLCATGYRAVYNPLPALQLNLTRYGVICISDKDAEKDFAHMKIVAAPDVLREQLAFYQLHLSTLANLLSMVSNYQPSVIYQHLGINAHLTKSGLVTKGEWFHCAKHSQGNDGTFVFLSVENNRLTSKNAGPKLLSDFDPTHIPLPLNFGLHYIRRYLQQQNVPQELIKMQLGHWISGEIPLSHYSTAETIQSMQTLNQFLNPMMSELGWIAKPSLLTRKKR